MHKYRTHTCGQLRREQVGERVRLSGWVARKRDHGGVLFLDLRDNYGVTQVVVLQSSPFAEAAAHVSKESVVRVDGTVQLRPEDGVNAGLTTGEIEIVIDDYEVLGLSDPLPFPIMEDKKSPEDLRLKHRYLDLRREKLHQNILLRSRIVASLRRRMTDLGFTEFQTPILTSSSPEGARDYLVPSRRHEGHFYALPQAPQQFKQLLMVSGFDRYFQIAPCFRDEDSRADRSPGEFYQLDLEMSFATQEDVFEVVEDVLAGVFTEFGGRGEITPPFVRIPFADSMLRFGNDKPDLRIPVEIVDLTPEFQASGFQAFAGKTVRALRVPGAGGQSRSWFDKMTQQARDLGAAGLAWLSIGDEGELKGQVGKFLSDAEKQSIVSAAGLQAGDAVFLVANDKSSLPSYVLGHLRVRMAEELGLINDSEYRFCWITDFPMFEKNEDTGQIEFSHNPFSMPQGGMDALLNMDPLDIKAFQYDIVCNGYELSSGAVRNHDPQLMYKAFEIAGYGKEVVDEKFPALQQAFRFGPPPHAGVAPGVDRIVMLITGEPNIREVIAFPMNQQAQDLMMNAPAPVSDQQLRDVHIRVVHTEQPTK